MASFQKYKKRDGSIVWRVQLFVNNVRLSKSFDTKPEAKSWAAQQEASLLLHASQSLCNPEFNDKKVKDIFERYAQEVSPQKTGARWEIIRLNSLIRDPLAAVPLAAFGPEHLVQWRDERLKQVSTSTVRREMTLMGHALQVAKREWRWLETNPSSDVKKPSDRPHRTQRINAEDLNKLLGALGYKLGRSPQNKSHEVAIALLLALETAMRSGEILSLTREHVHLDKFFVHLPHTKNGSSRNVPLSKAAIDLLQLMLVLPPKRDGKLFSVTARTKDVLFRRAKVKADLKNITFHDSRREGTSRLSEIFSPLELAKITGHKDLSMLLVYYEKSATELAAKMGGGSGQNKNNE